MNTTASDVLTPVPVPLWLLLVLVFLLIAATLWAAMPHLMKRAPTRWPFPGPTLNAFTAFLALVGAALFLVAIGAAFAVLRHTILNALVNPTEGISLGAGSLIAALLGAPFLIWGTVLRHQTVRWQKEGHMTDRISKAVEQLGAEKTVKKDGVEETRPNLEVRIGAILSLERIAQDSTTHDRGRDHVRVMEILCAYIRNNSPLGSIEEQFPFSSLFRREIQGAGGVGLSTEARYSSASLALSKVHSADSDVSLKSTRHAFKLQSMARTDIQHAIWVIGRRTNEQRAVEHGISLETFIRRASAIAELKESWLSDPFTTMPLSHRDLSKNTHENFNPVYRLDLSGVNFQGFDFSEHDFSGAKFCGSHFGGSVMRHTKFTDCDFTDCTFEEGNMEFADFSHATFTGSSFISCNAYSASFFGASLSFVTFLKGILSLSDFSLCFLSACSFYFSNMSKVAISKPYGGSVSIGGCELGDSRFSQVDFDQHSLFKSNKLRGTAFRNVSFSCDFIEASQISLAFGDGSVVFRTETVLPKHWPVWALPDAGQNCDFSYTEQLDRWRSYPASYTPPPPPETP